MQISQPALSIPRLSSADSVPNTLRSPTIIKDTPLPNTQGLPDFKTLVFNTLQLVALQYNTPNITLTAPEVFSLTVHCKYYSSTRGECEVLPTPTYFKRVCNVLMKYCKRVDSRFQVPKIFQ